MNKFQWIQLRIDELTPVAKRYGYSPFRLFLSFEICKRVHGATMEQFITFRMFDMNNRLRRRYLTVSRCYEMQSILNGDATESDVAALEDKHLFVSEYKDFVQRDCLYIPDAAPAQLRAFIQRNPRFLLKDCDATQGFGIEFYERESMDVDAFIEQKLGKPCLLEAYVTQHKALAAVNPASLNTVRIVTARYNGRTIILSAFLRVGGEGQQVDNFHHGGVVYHLDIESGQVMLPGKDYLSEHTYLRHPTTGVFMPGFQVPHWDMVVEQSRAIAEKAFPVGLVAWDVAVKDDGIEFIEANVNLPGPTAMQLYGPGIYDRLKALIHGAADEKEDAI